MCKKRKATKKTIYYGNTSQALALLRPLGKWASPRNTPRATLREEDSAADHLFLNWVTSVQLMGNI